MMVTSIDLKVGEKGLHARLRRRQDPKILETSERMV